MSLRVKAIELRKVPISTRMPFRFGITTLTKVDYLLVFADFEIDGAQVRGIAADVLAPKWFTKNPEIDISIEHAEMLSVISTARRIALEIAEQPTTFRWWKELYERVMNCPDLTRLPPLLKGFGVSLLERAAIDAFCRHAKSPFHKAVRSNSLGIQLGEIHTELLSTNPSEYLPEKPAARMAIRHTIGLSDPIHDEDVLENERLDDGLPQSLETCMQWYNIRYLKIKLPDSFDEAVERLLSIAALVERSSLDCKFTLDGNECFKSAAAFRNTWEALELNSQLSRFLADRLIAVEQPLHRDTALSNDTFETFRNWSSLPRIIIDESDGELGSLRRALEVGYVGTSHKNCKGVFKGIANACLTRYLNQRSTSEQCICTGEDLMNLGPVALLQDLAVGATLGFQHMERNGHHFVAGLSPFHKIVQNQCLEAHGDLYRVFETTSYQYPSLAIERGEISLVSVNRAPFGYAIDLDAQLFELVDNFQR